MIRQGILVFEDTPQGTKAVKTRVAALALLDRDIRTMERAGIEQLLVIAPAGGDLSITALTQRLELRLEFTTWEALQGAALFPTENFLLLLGDYVHHHTSLSQLLATDLEAEDLVVQAAAPPQKDGQFFEVSAAAQTVSFAATEAPVGQVSAGAFLCAGDLFSAAEIALGGENMHAFLQEKVHNRSAATRTLEPPLWRRVFDRHSARAAKNMLFAQVTKKTSGFVSRHINARISIPTSKLLIETGISPHMVTVLLVLTTGLAAAWLVTRADEYLYLAVAGTLWQFAAIFDRCDGEIARVKLCESKFGAWFDTVTDNIAYVAAYICLLIGIQRRHPQTDFYIYLGISAILALLVILTILYSYARKTGSGSLQHYLSELALNVPSNEKTLVQHLMTNLGFMAKRDFFSFVIFLAAIANQLEIAYWYVVVVLHLATLGVLISQGKMLRAHARANARQTTEHTVPNPRQEQR